MNLQQIKLFVTIAETKNITQAAKQLFISQPAVSRQLSLLESELGYSLLIRNNRGVELSDTGEVLYARGKRILNDLDDMAFCVREADTDVQGLIIIGTIYTCIPLLTRVLQEFQRDYPNVTFRILPDIPHRLVEDLSKGNIQLALLRAPMSETHNFPYMLFQPEQTCLAIHESIDPNPDSDVIQLEQLQNIPICFSMQNQKEFRNWDYGAILQEECLKRDFPLRRTYECSGTIADLMLTCSGLAASCIPQDTLGLFQCEHVRFKRIAGVSLTTQPLLLWNSDNHTTKALLLLLDYFKAQAYAPVTSTEQN